jgi:hypothetical protein
MAGTYFKYAERNAQDQINWAEVGKNMSDMLLEEARIREEKKAAIDQASREFGEVLANAPTGDYDAGNTFALDYANSAQEIRLMQDRLLKSGQLSVKDYLIARQNVNSGTNQIFDLAQEYQNEYSVKMKRWQDGDSSGREVWEMEQAEGLANLRASGGYINPTNGVVSIGKKVKNEATGVMELSQNPNDFVTVNELRGRLKQQYDRFNVGEATAASVERLGEQEQAITVMAGEGGLNQIISDIDAKRGNYTLEDEAVVRTYLDWEKDTISSLMVNPNDMASVLTDYKVTTADGEEYSFTYDKTEWENDTSGKLIFIDRSKNAAGEVVLKNGQKETVEEALRVGIRAAIDEKRQIKGSNRPYKPSDKREDDSNKDSQADVMSNIAALYYGDDNEVDTALSSIRGLNSDIERLERTPDGVTITYANGDTEFESFKDANGDVKTQREFVEGITNKLLTDKLQITNFDEIAKRGKIRFDRTFNDQTNRFDEVQREKRLGFDETYNRTEGAKLDLTTIKTGKDADNSAAQNSAVSEVDTFVRNVSGLSGYSARGFRAAAKGYGVVVENADGDNVLEIRLDTATPEELENFKQTLLGMGLNNSKAGLYNDESAQKAYIDQYGFIKPGTQTTTTSGGGGPVPRN